MGKQRMDQMQQEAYTQMAQDVQVADLTATFLNKRVRPSDVSTRRSLKRWQAATSLNKCVRLKAAHNKMVARRGCVVEILEPDYRRGIIAGLRIHWDNGAESNCLAYMVTLAED